ncbi:Type-1 restriction enzyme R protein [Acholeplasma oculi]|uniref:Type I restriction enzyme endonuclease subunit n=1 Tax=Acholeplasma oculi TaxID=35623 RepID=A0A061AC18_9MOLU|nr:type I restriction endonuclease subunit R [Acholeplasma oculi]CDR30954.1 Restriction endonuclease, type I HsdR [Acholeplasma oculi]SKC35752.1 type I restriction enzyme, R subunit [Acholeplasma oculi]SUT90270.1 Type-1 restriction enzyme R protein [Acholeplasma oculi]
MSSYKFSESELENALIALIDKHDLYQYMDNETDSWISTRNLNDFINDKLLIEQLRLINPDVRSEIILEVVKRIKFIDNPSLFERNRIFHNYLVNGITVDDDFSDVNPTIKLIDFVNVNNNVFQISHQIVFNESRERSNRKPDVIIFINGIPLILMELKSIDIDDDSTTLENAYMQLGSNTENSGYRYDIPTLFNYNAFLVISDGVHIKVGTLTSKLDRFNEWKSIDGEPGYDDSCINKLQIFVDGLLEPKRLLDVIQHHIFFIDNKNRKSTKIMAQYFQYFGVLRSLESIKNSKLPHGDGKAGIVWHTQGSGKSFSMVMLAHRLMLEKDLNVPTIIVLTDRIDLDDQIYKTFESAKEFLNVTPTFTTSRKDLVQKIEEVQQGGIILSVIAKFDKNDVRPNLRDNIIVMADEAHRGHYGVYEKISYKYDKENQEYELITKFGTEKYIRETLPNATFIGFTGTPVTTKEKSTADVYGNVIDTYDMTQSVIDGSTVRIFYEGRLAKIWTDEKVINQIDDYYKSLETTGQATSEAIDKSKKEMSKLKVILEDDDVLRRLAIDILEHYDGRKDFLHGKAMIVVSTRKSAIKLYNFMIEQKPEYTDIVIPVVTESNKDTEEMRDLFKNSAYRKELAEEFKKEDSKYKIAIVVDMWLTGFDVPDLDVIYFFKRLKSHALMQAIARVNRVYPGKEHGLIVDYIGLNKLLENALEEYTARDRDFNIQDIQKEAYNLLKEKLSILNELFVKVEKVGFYTDNALKRFKAIQDGVEFIIKDKKQETIFIEDLSLAIKQTFVICSGVCTLEQKEDIFYYLAVRSYLLKLRFGTSKVSISEINNHVKELLADALQSDEVKVLTKARDDSNVIDLLRPEKIDELRKNNPPHVFIEIIKKLLERAIHESRKHNMFKSQEYSERLRRILKTYHDRDGLFDTVKTITEIIDFAHDVVDDEDKATSNGLYGRERAFYDALIRNKSAKELMKDETLKLIAQELRATVEEYATSDWTKKKATQATMRVKIKELLKKYNYPPEYEKEAMENVINQAAYMMDEN